MASENPPQETVVRVEAGWYDGNKLDVFTANELDQTTPDWTARTGTPTAIVQLLSGSITLYPIPVIAAGLKLRVSLRPADESTDLPDQNGKASCGERGCTYGSISVVAC